MNPQKNNFWPWLLLSGFILLGASGILFRKNLFGTQENFGKDYPFRMLEVTADSAFIWVGGIVYSDTGTFALPVADKDLLFVFVGTSKDETGHFVPYRLEDSPHWALKGDSSFLYVNEELVSIVLDTMPHMLKWLEENRTKKLEGLKMIHFKSGLPKNYPSGIAEFIANNPQASIWFFDGQQDLRFYQENNLTPYIPKAVSLNLFSDEMEVDPEHLKIKDLPFVDLHLSKIERDSVTSYNYDLSPHFYENLGSVFPKAGNIGLSNFSPEEMQQIINILDPLELSIGGDTLENLDFFTDAHNIRALSIGPVRSLKGIKRLKKLERLSLNILAGAEGIDEVHNLQYLSHKGHPDDLAIILPNNPGLKYLSVVYDTLLTTLDPLKSIPQVVGLALPNLDSVDVSTMADLPELRYVGTKFYDNNEQLIREKIKQHCPQCMVYYATDPFFGICLGSGWLILLIPLALLLAFGYILIRSQLF